MKYKNAVKFRSDLFFNGSVEIDCVYTNRELASQAANSYVFHSKKSFTKSSDDKIDTIGLIKEIFDIAYSDTSDNPFMTAIAGYGSGKSHLGTAIAALFANNKNFLENQKVLENLEEIDFETSQYLRDCLKKPNIVFAINGMENIDLTSLMYNQIKEYVALSGINIPLFTKIEMVYSKAKLFISSNFNNSNFQQILNKLLQMPTYKSIKPTETYLSDHISDDNVFSLINLISEEITGNRYVIENYLSPNLILNEIGNELCGEDKPFGKIIVIFDELGRYIEWVGEKKSVDSSSMQQLYEGIKNSEGKAVLLSFIQFPLTTYFSHLAPSNYASIERYIGRYRNARIYHLSTILETVFANLVEIVDPNEFEDYSKIQKTLLRWQPELNSKAIWTDEMYYQNVICDKLKAFHPLTISLLSKLSEYTQKRGPLVILKELLEKYQNTDIAVARTIVPISILNTSFKEDVLKMEQSGLLKSDNVSLYDQLISRPTINSHLSAEDKGFLESILVINLLNLHPESKEDYYYLLGQISGLSSGVLARGEDHLEQELGVIRYDDELFYHHIILDSVGQKDFNHFFVTKRNEINRKIEYYDPQVISSKLKLLFSEELASFKTKIYVQVKTLEWEFPQTVYDIREDFTKIISEQLTVFRKAIFPNSPKGEMIWLYLNSQIINNIDEILSNIESLAVSLNLDKTPIQIGILLDSEAEIYNLIIDHDVIENLTNSEKERYAAFINTKHDKIKIDLKNQFLKMKKEAIFIIDNKQERSSLDFKSIFNKNLDRNYSRAIPFNFPGFHVSKYHNARAEFIQIIKVFSRRDLALTTFETTLQPNTYNRFVSLFGRYGWDALENDELTKPNQEKVKYLFQVIETKLESLSEGKLLNLAELFITLLGIEYGLNIYSADLIFIFAAHFYRDQLSFHVNERDYGFESWVLLIHNSDVDYDKIKQTTVKYIDLKKKKESAEKILQKVLEEKSIIEISRFYSVVDNIDKDFSFGDELDHLLSQVKARIYDASKLTKLYDSLTSVFQTCNSSFDDNNDSVVEILKNYNGIKKDWDELDKEVEKSSLLMPKEWIEEFKENTNLSREFLNKNFGNWFDRNKMPVNNNTEAYIAFNKRIIKSLYLFDLNDFAKQVQQNLVDISDSYELFNLISQQISNLSNENMPADTESCKDYRKKINDLIQEISLYSTLKDKQKLIFIESLANLEKKVEVQIKRFNNNIADIWDFISEEEITSMEELDLFYSNLKNVLKTIDKKHSDYQYLNDIATNIASIKEDLLTLKDSYIDKKDIENNINLLCAKYKENLDVDPETVLCIKLFENYKNLLFDKVDRDILTWISYLPTKNIQSYSDAELKKYLAYVKNIPAFLGENEIKIVEEMKGKILVRLDSSMIEEILSLFERIQSKEIKDIIINRLNKIMEDI